MTGGFKLSSSFEGGDHHANRWASERMEQFMLKVNDVFLIADRGVIIFSASTNATSVRLGNVIRKEGSSHE